jgi:hypothetical protein
MVISLAAWRIDVEGITFIVEFVQPRTGGIKAMDNLGLYPLEETCAYIFEGILRLITDDP